jgi:SAM-dependent methyltransferase
VSYDSAVSRGYLAAPRVRPLPRAAPIDPMSPALDDLSLKFVLWTRDARHDGLDVGCGEGIATAAALARGGHVTAVDPDQGALLRLLARIPPHVYPRLAIRRARIQELDFKFAHFAAVHASRVFHLLDPAALQQSLRKFFRWLYPEGKLFISTLAPSGSFWEPIHPELARRQRMHDPWPGFLEDLDKDMPQWGYAGESVHLLDRNVLARELELAGFHIEELTCDPLPWDGDQHCCSAIARCGQ